MGVIGGNITRCDIGNRGKRPLFVFEKSGFGKKNEIWQTDFFITNFFVKSCLSYTYYILVFVFASFVEEGTGGSFYGTATQQ